MSTIENSQISLYYHFNPKTAGGRGVAGGGGEFDPPPVVFKKMYLLKGG